MLRLGCILLILLSSTCLEAIDYERFEENGKIGLRNNYGQVVLPADFDALGWSDGQFSLVGNITGYRQHGRWGLISTQRQFLTDAEYETITSAGGDRVVVSKLINPYTIKYGCLDLQGKLVIPFVYDDIDVHGLRAIVMIKNGLKYEHGLIDLNDRSIIPIRYEHIVPIGSLRYAVRDFNQKIAICTEEGKWMTKFFIDEISDFQFDHAIIKDGWRRGVINRHGDIVLDPSYRDIHILSADRVEASKAAKWSLMDQNFKTLQTIDADELTFHGQGWNTIQVSGKTGICDDNFQILWPFQYDQVGALENGKAIAYKEGHYALLRKDRSEVLPFEFDSLCTEGNYVRTLRFVNGVQRWELFDTLGIRKSNAYDFIGAFNGSFFPVKKGAFWGGLDRFGSEKIACVYDSLVEANLAHVVVKFKGHYGVINTNDEWIVKPQSHLLRLVATDRILFQEGPTIFIHDLSGNVIYFTDNPVIIYPEYLFERLPDGKAKHTDFNGRTIERPEPVYAGAEEIFSESEGMIGIRKNHKYGFVDKKGRLLIANRYDSIGEFHEGKAPVFLVGKWGYLNKSDEIVIQPNFDKATDFKNGIAIVGRTGQTGLIDATGNIVLELRYDSISRLPDNHFVITSGGLKGLVDAKGRILIEPRFESLTMLPHQRVIVSRAGKSAVLTYEGLNELPAHYSHLRYLPLTGQFLTKEEPETKILVLK